MNNHYTVFICNFFLNWYIGGWRDFFGERRRRCVFDENWPLEPRGRVQTGRCRAEPLHRCRSVALRRRRQGVPSRQSRRRRRRRWWRTWEDGRHGRGRKASRACQWWRRPWGWAAPSSSEDEEDNRDDMPAAMTHRAKLKWLICTG